MPLSSVVSEKTVERVQCKGLVNYKVVKSRAVSALLLFTEPVCGNGNKWNVEPEELSSSPDSDIVYLYDLRQIS